MKFSSCRHIAGRTCRLTHAGRFDSQFLMRNWVSPRGTVVQPLDVYWFDLYTLEGRRGFHVFDVLTTTLAMVAPIPLLSEGTDR